ncbi:hypothetical protein AAHS21_11915 [Mycobacterium sp. 050272]|uniref:hypothetical protein n=1 Tax=Mycobacterium sp. 050272 TaxID=3142488 RepID=UPI0031849AF8
MGWFQRAKKTGAGQRVTRADQQHAIDAVAELHALGADRERLLRDGPVRVDPADHWTVLVVARP